LKARRKADSSVQGTARPKMFLSDVSGQVSRLVACHWQWARCSKPLSNASRSSEAEHKSWLPGCSRGAVAICSQPKASSVSSPPPFSLAVNGGTAAVVDLGDRESQISSRCPLVLTFNIQHSRIDRHIFYVLPLCTSFLSAWVLLSKRLCR
jgi:hypothetical protein